MKPKGARSFGGGFFVRLIGMLLFPLRGKSLYSVRLLRRPGEWSARQMDNLMDDLLVWHCVCIGIFTGVIIGKAVSAVLPPQWEGAFWLFLAVVAAAALIYAMRRTFDEARKFKIAYLAECKTAEFLERLGRPEWRVIHGFKLHASSGDGEMDIDHIVVCPHGIFCVETKAVRKFKDEESNGSMEYTPPDDNNPQSFGTITCNNGHQDERKRVRRRLGNGGKESDRRKNPMGQAKDNAGILWGRLKGRFPDNMVRRIVVCPGWRVIRKGKSQWEFVSSGEDSESEKILGFITESRRELDEAEVGKIAAFLENEVREEKREINEPDET